MLCCDVVLNCVLLCGVVLFFLFLFSYYCGVV